jgi:hypothetical protein
MQSPISPWRTIVSPSLYSFPRLAMLWTCLSYLVYWSISIQVAPKFVRIMPRWVGSHGRRSTRRMPRPRLVEAERLAKQRAELDSNFACRGRTYYRYTSAALADNIDIW